VSDDDDGMNKMNAGRGSIPNDNDRGDVVMDDDDDDDSIDIIPQPQSKIVIDNPPPPLPNHPSPPPNNNSNISSNINSTTNNNNAPTRTNLPKGLSTDEIDTSDRSSDRMQQWGEFSQVTWNVSLTN
jgi:hypothetical protein